MNRFMWLWLCLGLSLTGHACGLQGLQQVIDRDGVRVWTCDMPDQTLRGFKAVTTVDSTLGGLISLIMDTGAASEWVYRTDRIELLKRDDDSRTFTVRAEADFWPLKDRDVVMDGRIVQDPDTLTVTVDSRSVANPQFPQRDKFVRMPSMWGRWEFRPLGNGKVEVTMSGHADPGGRIPDFLINMVVEDTPFQTLLGLRRMLAAGKYQRLRLDGIRER
ncbi:MAG: hypothetical protein K0R03_1205 [Moraxellaceae bacterium]|jgi:hypothetical protein|nr:hypothetical protein [Moraxellaceae bacterium]